MSTVCAVNLWNFPYFTKKVPSSSDSDESGASAAKVFVALELVSFVKVVWASSSSFVKIEWASSVEIVSVWASSVERVWASYVRIQNHSRHHDPKCRLRSSQVSIL